jgi:hypothetical protein
LSAPSNRDGARDGSVAVGGLCQSLQAPRETKEGEQHTISDGGTDRTARDPFRRDHLRGLPGRVRLPCHPARQLAGVAPEDSQAIRTGDAQHDGRLAVDELALWIGDRIGERGLTASVAVLSDQRFKDLDRAATRPAQPHVLIVAIRNPREQTDLRPRELSGMERGCDPGQIGETCRHPGRALERPRRDSETLARVVGETHEPKTAVAPAT